MKFLAESQWLWLAVIILPLAGFLWVHGRRKTARRLQQFVAARLLPSLMPENARVSRLVRLGLFLTGVTAILFALARPMGEPRDDKAKRQGIDFIIALDVSKSMLAEDVEKKVGEKDKSLLEKAVEETQDAVQSLIEEKKVESLKRSRNRLEFARDSIKEMLKKLSGDRVGLIVFAGKAHQIAPMTFDYSALNLILDYAEPGMTRQEGSNLTEVIKMASETFREKPYDSKVLLIITDGEELEGDSILAASGSRIREGMRIFTAGVGSPGGAPIIIREKNDKGKETGKFRYHANGSGQTVHSRLDERRLREIARAGAGNYRNIVTTREGLVDLYENGLKPLSKKLDSRKKQDRYEWFQVPLGIALIFLLLEMLVRERPRGKRKTVNPRVGDGVPSMARPAMGAFLLIGFAGALWAGMEAEQLVGKDPEKAFDLCREELLKSPENPYHIYNYAVAAYAAKKYDVAIQAWEKLAESDVAALKTRSMAQLGNADFRLGEQLEKTSPESTVFHWQKALENFKRALEKDSRNLMAKNNYPYVQERLKNIHLSLARKLADQADGKQDDKNAELKVIPLFEGSLGHYDEVLKLDPGHPEAPVEREVVRGKLEKAHVDWGDKSLQEAEKNASQPLPEPKLGKKGKEPKKEDSPPNNPHEKAVEQFRDAMDHYDKALAQNENNEAVKTQKPRAEAGLEDLLLRMGDKQAEVGDQIRPTEPARAIPAYQAALDKYTEATMVNPGSEKAQAKKMEMENRLHDLLVQSGDEQKAKGDMASTKAETRQDQIAPVTPQPAAPHMAEALHQAQTAQEAAIAAQKEADQAQQQAVQTASPQAQKAQQQAERAQQQADKAQAEAQQALSGKKSPSQAQRAQQKASKAQAQASAAQQKAQKAMSQASSQQDGAAQQKAAQAQAQAREAQQKANEALAKVLEQSGEKQTKAATEAGSSRQAATAAYTKAVEDYSRALGIKPDDPPTQQKLQELQKQLGQEYANLGDIENHQAQQFQQSSPDRAIAHMEKAVKSYDLALNMNPSDSQTPPKLQQAQAALEAMRGEQASKQNQASQGQGQGEQGQGQGQGEQPGQGQGEGEGQPGQPGSGSESNPGDGMASGESQEGEGNPEGSTDGPLKWAGATWKGGSGQKSGPASKSMGNYDTRQSPKNGRDW